MNSHEESVGVRLFNRVHQTVILTDSGRRCAEVSVDQKATLMELADILEHKTLQMVKCYSHPADAHTQNVVSKMNNRDIQG